MSNQPYYQNPDPRMQVEVLVGTDDPENMRLPLYDATFKQAVQRFIKGYLKFDGRASRSEFWWPQLVLFGIGLVFSLLFSMTTTSSFQYLETVDGGIEIVSNGLGAGFYFVLFLSIIFYLAVLFPSLAITWRRLHDAGFSGLFFLFSFIPFVGGLILLALLVMPSSVKGLVYDVQDIAS